MDHARSEGHFLDKVVIECIYLEKLREKLKQRRNFNW
jgi:hypothetical protein